MAKKTPGNRKNRRKQYNYSLLFKFEFISQDKKNCFEDCVLELRFKVEYFSRLPDLEKCLEQFLFDKSEAFSSGLLKYL